jgi:hypothetical protein
LNRNRSPWIPADLRLSGVDAEASTNRSEGPSAVEDATTDEPVVEATVSPQPLQIGMEFPPVTAQGGGTTLQVDNARHEQRADHDDLTVDDQQGIDGGTP